MPHNSQFCRKIKAVSSTVEQLLALPHINGCVFNSGTLCKISLTARNLLVVIVQMSLHLPFYQEQSNVSIQCPSRTYILFLRFLQSYRLPVALVKGRQQLLKTCLCSNMSQEPLSGLATIFSHKLGHRHRFGICHKKIYGAKHRITFYILKISFKKMMNHLLLY